MKRKVLKKIFVSVFTAILTISVFTVSAGSYHVSACGGCGDNHYGNDHYGYTVIKTAKELDTIVRKGLSGKYRLGNDIDLSGYTSTTNSTSKGWTGIGGTNYFSGVLDGDGYTIKGLWANNSGSYTGLFSKTNGASISNLNIEIGSKGITGCSYVGGVIGLADKGTKIQNVNVNGNIIGDSYVGGITGKLTNESSITNSLVKGKIASSTTYGGGLVGLVADRSTVSDSCSKADVTGKTSVGGVIGSLEDGSTVSKTTAYGTVLASGNYAGGLIGSSYGSAINNSNALGNVKGNCYVGGFVGYLGNAGNRCCASKTAVNTITNCYSAGKVTGNSYTAAFSGYSGVKFMGKNYYDCTTAGVSKAYGSGDISGSSSSYPQGKTTVNMKKKATFSGWDFYKIWKIDENQSYPYLDNCDDKDYCQTEVTITFDKNNVAATGTMTPQVTTSGAVTTLNSNAYVLDKYIFLGWSTTPTGNVEYANNGNISVTKNTTLYAIWGTPDLYGDIQISDDTLVAYQYFTFTVTIGNRDSANATPWYNTNVLITLPQGASYIHVPSITLNGVVQNIPYTYNSVDHTISFSLGTLEPGQEYKLVYGLQANADVIAGERLESSYWATGDVGLIRAFSTENTKTISGSTFATIAESANSITTENTTGTDTGTSGGRFGGSSSGTITK